MLIYGAGGHAKVIFGMLAGAGIKVEAVFDDQSDKCLFSQKTISYAAHVLPGNKLIVAIGDNYDRRNKAEKVSHEFGVFSHESAIVDASVSIGQGSVIFQRAIIQVDSLIGNHVIINTNALIEHECCLGDFVHVAPRATLCGNVKVGDNTLLGAGCIILPNLSIGKNCIVGAGSVVTRSIPDNTIVAGNPARILH